MQKESQTYKIAPADRLASVSEYYFSKKLKEVAQMNAEGKDVISLGIGSPDMPPSRETIETLCNNAHDPNGHGYQPYVGIYNKVDLMPDFKPKNENIKQYIRKPLVRFVFPHTL